MTLLINGVNAVELHIISNLHVSHGTVHLLMTARSVQLVNILRKCQQTHVSLLVNLPLMNWSAVTCYSLKWMMIKTDTKTWLYKLRPLCTFRPMGRGGVLPDEFWAEKRDYHYSFCLEVKCAYFSLN